MATAAGNRIRVRMTPAARQRQLIEAATELIARDGFHGFSITALADACSISRAGVLHHFASAEELLVAVLRHRDAADLDALGPDWASVGTNAEARDLLRGLVRRNAGQRELVRLYTVLSAEALNAAHPAHRYFADRLRITRARIGEALAWRGDAAAVALEILSVMDGLQLAWLRDPAIDLVASWDAYADVRFADVASGQ